MFLQKECVPNNMTITQHKASVPLQDILDHTASRIVIGQQAVFESANIEGDKIELVSKIGFDGTGNQSEYNQLWMGGTPGSDKTVILTAVVPLILHQNCETQSKCGIPFLEFVKFLFYFLSGSIKF